MTAKKPVTQPKPTDAERRKRMVETTKQVAPKEEPEDFDWAFDATPKARGKP